MIHYTRCPFLVPVKSKHTYRVPRGGKYDLLAVQLPQAPYATSMALNLYSPTFGPEAREFPANNKAEVQRQRLNGVEHPVEVEMASRGKNDRGKT